MTRNADLFARAQRLLPGGVNSPVRSFNAVGGTPPFVAAASGGRFRDEDGRELLDLCLSWGPLILGHAHPRVVGAVRDAALKGLTYGACHAAEADLAEAIAAALPHVPMVRMVSSGTEAAMAALRLARAATGRDLVLKFAGCYHGHADPFLVAAGSGALTLGHPSSPGVPAAAAGATVVLPYNDAAAVDAAFAAHPKQIAAVILEPVVGNMGVVLPDAGYLQALRAACTRHGALLIFDEVITGFRIHPGGAAAWSGVTPDLTVLGKIVGGGLPLGAFGGDPGLMRRLAPCGPVYQAGTLSGNPLSCAAGLATLRELREHPPYAYLDALGRRLEEGLRADLARRGVPAVINRIGSMLTLFFGHGPVRDLASATACDAARFGRYHQAMLARGIYLPPAAFEAWFLCTAHGEADIDLLLRTHAAAMDAVG